MGTRHRVYRVYPKCSYRFLCKLHGLPRGPSLLCVATSLNVCIATAFLLKYLILVIKRHLLLLFQNRFHFFVEERRLKFKHRKFNSQCCSIFIGRIIVVFAVCAVSCCFSVLLSSFIDAFCATKTVYENIQYKADFFLDVVNNVMSYTVSWKPTDFCPAVSVQQPGLLNTPVLNVYLQDAEKRTPRVRI